MKRKRFTEEQIIAILKQADSGTPVKELCRTHGINQTSLYRWKSKFGDMNVSDARKLRSLEEENRKLKKLVADLSIDNMVLKDINSKKW